jgi:hypothetical protein
MGKVAWNKGLTKKNNTSVRRISRTMKEKHLDNFAEWRKEARKRGLVKSKYQTLKKNADLAELLGAILGDGYVGKHPRTECLRIVSNSKNSGFTTRYTTLVERVFGKRPSVKKRKNSSATDIVIYERHIAKRLGLKVGEKTHRPFTLPMWIRKKRKYRIAFLRGLYETDGSLSYHEATYTHKFAFSNVNQSLLDIVYILVSELGFHPHRTKTSVQVSRKDEVAKLSKIVHFREYP